MSKNKRHSQTIMPWLTINHKVTYLRICGVVKFSITVFVTNVLLNLKKVADTRLLDTRFPKLIPVLGSQPAGDVSHKPGGRLPLLSARPAVTPCNPYEGCYQFCCLVNTGTMGVNSLPKTVTRQRRDCDLKPGPSAPESSTLTTRLVWVCQWN